MTWSRLAEGWTRDHWRSLLAVVVLWKKEFRGQNFLRGQGCSRVGRMPKLCLALGWRQNFLSFALLQQWRYKWYIPLCGGSCSIEKSEMLPPDKAFYECWKPVQREQRRLLFSQWVEPRERRGAPSWLQTRKPPRKKNLKLKKRKYSEDVV